MKKFYKSAFIVILALSIMGVGAGNAYAHGTHSPSRLSNGCLLRAGANATEASELTGKSLSGHASGQYLDLSSITSGGDHGLICMYGLVKWLTNLLFFILMAVATLVIAYAAFLFVAAGGNEERVKKARKYLVLSIVALIVAVLARAIPPIVRGILGL